MSIPFVNVDGFTPNLGQWTPVGAISAVTPAGNTFTLAFQSGGRSLQVSFLSPTCFRWDAALQTSVIKVFDTAADVTISVAH
jgi:hypothetical protein